MNHFFSKIVDFFKESQPDPGMPVQEDEEGGVPPKRPLMDQLADALKAAGSQFHYENIRPYQKYDSHAKFKLEQIVMVCTPENMGFFDTVTNMKSSMRQRIAEGQLADLGFDLSGFVGWRVMPSDQVHASDTPQDPFYTTYGSSKGYRVKLDFQFLGDFDEASANQVSKNNRFKAAQTMLDEPPESTRRKAAQTMLDDEPVRRPLARLRVRDFDGKEEIHDVFNLPFQIGREVDEGIPHALVAEACAKVSRIHLTFTKFQVGAMMVTNPAAQRSGTWYQDERLPEKFLITPVPANSQGGWHILGEKSLSQNSIAIRLEEAAS
jgi:hypothetical protein